MGLGVRTAVLSRLAGVSTRVPSGVALTFDDGPMPATTGAVLDALADLGHDGTSLDEIRRRAGRTEGSDEHWPAVEDLVAEAVSRVRLFAPPQATGCLRQDLVTLLRPWLGPRTRDERAIAAVLSAAEWCPRLKRATAEALDRPLGQALGAVLGRAVAADQLPRRRVPTISWLLRSLAVDRLRSGTPRTQVDLEQLVDHLIGDRDPDLAAAS